MKSILTFPPAIYLAATLASLGLMIIIDYLLGPVAEHLNAWVIVNRLFGRETDIGDSLAIRHLGLAGATVVMLLANALGGGLLIQLLQLVIRTIHA
ncbi:MAG: hypothetical protein KDC54_02595 [Lewinella sp.]|nr:hypothetical protein [Lewinella sp.]